MSHSSLKKKDRKKKFEYGFYFDYHGNSENSEAFVSALQMSDILLYLKMVVWKRQAVVPLNVTCGTFSFVWSAVLYVCMCVCVCVCVCVRVCDTVFQNRTVSHLKAFRTILKERANLKG